MIDITSRQREAFSRGVDMIVQKCSAEGDYLITAANKNDMWFRGSCTNEIKGLGSAAHDIQSKLVLARLSASEETTGDEQELSASPD